MNKTDRGINDTPEPPSIKPMKEGLAIGVCLISIVVGILAIRADYSLANVVMALSLTWNLAGSYASRLPRFYNKSLGEIFQIAKRSGLKDSAVASTISLGGMVLFLMWFVVIVRELMAL